MKMNKKLVIGIILAIVVIAVAIGAVVMVNSNNNDNQNIASDNNENVNNAITDILDKDDYIKEQYFLEVSSTGVEKMIRKDKHLKENIGEYITIKLFKPINNFKEYVGKLKSFDDQIITIEVENEELNIERKNISLIKK